MKNTPHPLQTIECHSLENVQGGMNLPPPGGGGDSKPWSPLFPPLQPSTQGSKSSNRGCLSPRRQPWVPVPLRRTDGGFSNHPLFPCILKKP